MTVLSNTAEGGTNGVTVSTGNSGGASGNAFNVIGNTPQYSTTSPIRGTMSFFCDGTAADYMAWTTSMPAAVDEGWIRIVGRFSAIPSANAGIVTFRESDAVTIGTDIRITSAGTIQIRPNLVAQGTSTTVITAGQLWRLEARCLSHASTGQIEVRLFVGANYLGDTPDETINLSNQNTGDGDIGGVAVGWITTPTGNPSLTLDDVAFSDEGWIGSPDSPPPPPAGVNLANNADGGTNGTNVTVGNSGGSSGDAFNLVNGTPQYTNVSPLLGSLSYLADGASAEYMVWTTSLPDVLTEAWNRFVGRISALPGGNTGIMSFRESDAITVGTDIQIIPTGAIRVRPNQVTQATSTVLVTAGEPFRVEARCLSHASTGQIEVRIFLGANYAGTTPDETINLSNQNTGDGNIGGLGFGWLAAPTGGPSLTFDGLAFSDEDWIGPPSGAPTPGGPDGIQEARMGMWSNSATVAVPTGGPPSDYDEILQPATGAWWGATVSPQDVQASSSQGGLDLWNSMTGIRPPQIIGVYKNGNWNGNFTAGELGMFNDSGDGDPAIPHVRWKPGNTSAAGSWGACATGTYNAALDTCFNNLKNYPGKVFLTIWHEPEDNIGASPYTTTEYRNMWVTVRARAELAGVTNVIWVINYVGYSNHAINASGQRFEDLYPGDAYIDWIAWDPYVIGDVRNTLAELLNENYSGTPGWTGFYNWASAKNKPLMLAEVGVDGGPDSTHGDVSAAEAAAIVDNWNSAIASFPNLKAWEYWHADGDGDYQFTGRPSNIGISNFVNFSNNNWFDQDVYVAVD